MIQYSIIKIKMNINIQNIWCQKKDKYILCHKNKWKTKIIKQHKTKYIYIEQPTAIAHIKLIFKCIKGMAHNGHKRRTDTINGCIWQS